MTTNSLLYARVSSKEQEVEGYSIPAQLKLLREYAAKNNFLVQREFTDVETAKKAGRTEFNKMIAFIKENKTIKHILVEKTDRLLRNITDYALIEHLIAHSGITIHLVKENVILSRDSRSNEKFIFGIKALMAKNYVDNLSEETKKNKYIYYHCTGHKGKCNQPYLKQETIEAEFEKLLGNIHITENEQKTIINGLRESHRDKVGRISQQLCKTA